MAGVSRYVAPTDILQPTLRKFFYKRWPIMCFYGRGCFLFCCCLKNLQCMSARFFRASSTEIVFRPTLACSHLVGQENVSPPRHKKNIIHENWWKKWLLTSAWRDDRSRSKMEASPDDADRTFPSKHHATLIQGMNIKLNSRHRSWNSPDWFFFKTLAGRWWFFFMAEDVFLLLCCIRN